ncbi:MAG: hypothetical protein KKB20_10690 [Proteobacteria bacterium]|nr:hypothetical protein [Pseudomonadota bacterium]
MADERKQTTPETEVDLDQIFADGMQVFQGELDEAARGNASPETEAIDPGAGPAEGEEPISPEHPKAPAEEAGDKERPEGEGPPETPPAPPAHRFKTHEEAEKGYRNLQAEKTRLEEEKADLAARLAAQDRAEQDKAARDKAEADILEFSKKRTIEALKAIDAIEPEDPEHSEKVAQAWAEKDRDIWAFEQGLTKAAGAPAPKEAGSGPETEPGGGEDTIAFIKERLKAAELNPDDPMFWMLAERVPAQDQNGQPMTFEQGLDWAVNQTKAHNAETERRVLERIKAAAAVQTDVHQEKTQPLGRSGAERQTTEEPRKIVTMSDAIDQAMEERRL